MTRVFCGRADVHDAHSLTGHDYCPGRPLRDGEATPYGPADTWPDVESGSSPRKPAEQPLRPVPWVDPPMAGLGWGG